MNNLYFNKPLNTEGPNLLKLVDAQTGATLVEHDISLDLNGGLLPPVTRTALATWQPDTQVFLNEEYQGTMIQCFDERA